MVPNRKNAHARVKALAVALTGLFVIFTGLLSVTHPVQAATSSNLNFQARLLTNTGTVVLDGNYNIDFKLYDADSVTGSVGSCSGHCLWEETRQNSNSQGVQVVNGYFSVNLGSVTAFPSTIKWDNPLWLTMNIGGTTTSASPTWDGEMQNSGHSIALTAIPYSFVAAQLAKTDSSGNRGTLGFNTVATNPAIILPDASGTVCLQSSAGANGCGYEGTAGTDFIRNQAAVQTANFNIQSGAVGSVAAVIQGASGQTADLLDIQNSTTVLSIGNNGQTLFKPTASHDSTTFFQIQPAGSSTPVFNVDTQNSRVGINNSAPAYALDVSGDINISSGSKYRVNGVAGLTSSCANTYYMDGATFTGGIVTGGNCTINNLQTVYANSGSAPTPSLIQEVVSQSNNSNSETLNMSSSSGDLLVAVVTMATGTSNSVSGITDSAGNTWTKATSGALSGNNTRVEIWYAQNATAVSTVTVNYTTSLLTTVDLLEFSGMQTSSVLDTANGQGNASSTSAPTPTITTTNANDLIISGLSYPSTSITTTGPGNPWTSLTNLSNSTRQGRAAYETVASTGSYSAAWTLSSASATGTAIAAFKISSATGTAILNLSNGKDLVINASDTATDPNFLINLKCVTSCGSNGRFAVQSNGTDVMKISPNGGAALFKNSANSTLAFQIQNAAGTSNLFVADTQNSKIGIGLTPSSTGAALQVSGSASASTSLLTPLLDTISTSGTLDIGTTNATGGISLDQNTTVSGTKTLTVNGGNTSLGANLDVTGSVAFKNSSTNFSTTGTSNDVSFGNVSLVRLTGASAQTITGISGGRDGYILTIQNAAAQAATLANQNTGSTTPGDRILTGSGADLALPPDGSVILVYDATTARWRITGMNVTGVSILGTYSSSNHYTNGASISGNTLTLGSADSSNPGLVDTSNQTFAGNKTFSGTLSVAPTTNIGSAVIKQTSAASPSNDIFDVQGTNGTSNFIQVTSTAANQGAVNISSFGSNNITLQAGSGTVSLGSSTNLNATGALTIASGGTSDLTLDSLSGTLKLGTNTSNLLFTDASTALIDAASGRTLGLGTGNSAHQTTLGSTNASATTTVQAGGGITLSGNTTVSSAKTFTVTDGATSLTNSTGVPLTVNNSSGSNSIALFQDNGTPVATIGDNGAVTFENSTNSQTAFQIQNNSASDLLNVNTTDGYIINNTTQDLGNILQNPGFEAGVGNSTDGTGWYTPAAGQAITNDPTNAHGGNNALEVTGNSTTHTLVTKYYAVHPGDTIYVEAWVKNSAGATGDAGIFIEYSDKDKANATNTLMNTGLPGTTYTLKSTTQVIPSGKYYVRLGASVKATATTGTFYFDDFYLKRVNEQAPLLLTANSTTAFQVQNSSGATVLGVDTSGSKIFTTIADGATSVGFTLNTPSYTTAGAKLISIQNNGNEKFSVDKDGNLNVTGGVTAGSDISTSGNVNIASGKQYEINGTQISSAALSNNSDLAKLDGTGPQVFSGNNEFDGTILNKVASTTAFQVQNASNAVLTVDTTGNRLILGTASNITGAIQFQGSGGTGKLYLVGPTTPDTGNWTLTIPTITANDTICTNTTQATACANYASASSLSSGLSGKLNKNSVDTSAASVTAVQGNLYAFTNNSNNIASGILKLDNGNNSGNALTVTGSFNYGAGNAYIVVNNTNATPSGRLIDLQTNATSEFNVDASGNVFANGNINIASGKLYEINGTQISSSNLSDGNTLAKLGANQTFSGNNTFSSASNSFTGDGSGLTNLNASNVASGTLNDGRLSSNVALLNRAGQTFTGDNTFAPTANGASTVIKQTSGTATSGSVLDVQTADGTGHFFQITNTAANQGAVTLQSIGASNALTLGSASGTLFVTAGTNTIQHNNSSLTIDVDNGTDSTLSIVNAQSNAAASLSVEGDVSVNAGRVYKVGTTSGVSTTCNSNTFLQNATTLGGIVTGGSCANAVTSIGTTGGSIANGASISGNTLTLGYADTSNPGLVSNTTQSFNGNKTFTNDLLVKTNSATAFQVQNTSNIPFMAIDTNSNIINIGVTGVTNANATVNIGNSNAGTQTVSIGSTNTSSASTTTINAGTGGISLLAAGGSSNLGVLVQSLSNTTNAFQIQNSSTIPVFNVDTSVDASNLITNGSFEVNTTGWTAKAGTGATPTLSRVTSSTVSPYVGNGALSVATSSGDATNSGVKWSGTFTNSQAYVFTLYARASGSNFSTFQIGNSNDNSTDLSCLTGQTVVTSGWTRFSCAFTYTGSTGTSYVYVKQTDSANRTYYLDGAKLEISSIATPYRESTISVNGVFNQPGTFRGQSDSTTAFQVQSSGGGNILVVDSLNKQLKVYDGAGGANYALIYYDSTNNIANYTTNTGTVAVGTGAGAITVTSGSGAAVNITANATSSWKTNSGTLTLQSGSGTSDFLILNSGGSGQVQISGSSVVKLGSATSDPTCVNGAIYYNSTSGVFRGCQAGAWATLGTSGPTLQTAYNNSTGSTTPEIKLNAGGTDTGAFDIQDADSTLNGVIFAVRGTNAGGLGTSLLSVDTSNNSVNIGTSASSTALLVLGSDTDSTFNQGTATNSASVVNGAMFYSASDHNFLCGTANQWITCNGLLYSNTSVGSAVSNCTSACGNIGSASIPGNYCQAGRVIHIYARGHYSTTGTPTLQMEVRYGTSATRTSDPLIGTGSPAATTGTSITSAQWMVDYKIICFSTASMDGQGVLYLQTVTTTTATGQFGIFNMVATASTTGLTTTSPSNIYVFPVWGTASSSNTITTDQYIVTGN